jgi:hypothetical protein
MSRTRRIALGIGGSLVVDGVLWLVVNEQARIKDATPLAWWWLLTVTLAVVAVVPLLDLARQGRVIERVLAAVFSLPPLGWIGLCAYAACH